MNPLSPLHAVNEDQRKREAWDEWLAAAALTRSRTPKPREKLAWVEQSGSCRAALDRLAKTERGRLLQQAEKERELAERHQIRALTITQKGYPESLKRIATPPLMLLYKGCIQAEELALAVVGSRNATRYGEAATRRLVGPLARGGFTIVSGLARGIDQTAHRTALEVSSRTIAVLGSGLLRIYPSEHTALAEEIAESGAVISEFALRDEPRPEHFPRRNRVVTGLSWGTLVVEATTKSGSLTSARHALEQDREVFAVPGPIDSENSEGVHALIRDGACIVHQPSDVWDELPRHLWPRTSPASHHSRASPSVPLDTDSQTLWSEFSTHERELSVDTLVDSSGLEVRRVLVGLGRLESAGLIIPADRGYYRRRITR